MNHTGWSVFWSVWRVMSPPPDWCHLLNGLSQWDQLLLHVLHEHRARQLFFTVTQGSLIIIPPLTESSWPSINSLLQCIDKLMLQLSVQRHHVESKYFYIKVQQLWLTQTLLSLLLLLSVALFPLMYICQWYVCGTGGYLCWFLFWSQITWDLNQSFFILPSTWSQN